MPERLSYRYVGTPRERDSQESIEIQEKRDSTFTGARIFFGTTPAGERVAVKFSGYAWGAKREWEGMQKVYNSGLSLPRPIGIVKDENGSLGIISERFEGRNLYEESDPELKFRLGNFVKNIHSSVPIEGAEWKSAGKNDFSFYENKTHEWRNSGIGVISAGTEIDELLREFGKTVPDHIAKNSPVFIHGDLHDGQAFVNPDRNLYVLDYEFWKECNPLNDLAIYLLHSLRTNRPREGFIELTRGYANMGNYTEPEKWLISFFLLFEAVKAIEYFYAYKPNAVNVAVSQLSKAVDYTKRSQLWVELK